MYLNFFNLNKEPFQITPDPSFLYLSPGHKEALASIIYGVEKKKGFVLITGAVGTGKTTILRAYLETAEKVKLRTIYLFNANVSYHNLLRYIFRELSLVAESDEISDMVNQLHRTLIHEYRQGRNILLLIDEAQNMPVDTLENLRMLSNLETATEKLIQIVFSAQPEFEKTLDLKELKQLKQRIAVKAVIHPLTREESLAYVHHRLRKAADRDPVIFSPTALKEIVWIASGIPRVINVLCDNSLITAFGYGKKKVGIRVVKEICRDFGMQKPFFIRWRLSLLIALLTSVTLYFASKESAVLSGAKLPLPVRGAGITQAAPSQSDHLKAEPEPASEKASVTRLIARGDTLAGLIKDVYGRVDAKLIKLVKNANSHIDDEDLIIEGGHIVFPPYRGR